MSNNNSGKECDHDEGIRTSGGLATTLVEGRCNLCGTYVGRFDNSGKVEELIATYLEGLHNPSDDPLYNALRADRDTKALKKAVEKLISSKVNEARIECLTWVYKNDNPNLQQLIRDRIRTLKEPSEAEQSIK